MSVNLGRLASQALRVARREKVAGTATIARPIDGVVTEASLTQTIGAVEMRPSRVKAKPDSSWLAASATIFVAANDAQFVPRNGDHLTWAGRTGIVAIVDIVAPAGTPIGYEIAVGAA